MTKFLSFILVSLIMFSSCKQNSDTNTQSNISSTVSTDTTKLAKLVDLKLFRPISVKYKYTLVDNSGQNERLSVPGPSDSYLEAILFYDTTTFRRLIGGCNADYMKYIEPNYDSPNLKKELFNFEWLDKNIKDELLKSDTSYQGDFDKYFGTAPNGRLWLLNNKILIYKTTQ